MKSTYSLPSTSQMCEPRPCSRNRGPPEYVAFPREGEFTPSTRDCSARSSHCWERVRLRVGCIWVMRVCLRRCCQTTAVDDQGRARDKGSRVTGQIERGLRDFFGLAHPPQRATR